MEGFNGVYCSNNKCFTNVLFLINFFNNVLIMNNMLVKDPYHTLSNNVCITRNDFAFEKSLDKNFYLCSQEMLVSEFLNRPLLEPGLPTLQHIVCIVGSFTQSLDQFQNFRRPGQTLLDQKIFKRQ